MRTAAAASHIRQQAQRRRERELLEEEEDIEMDVDDGGQYEGGEQDDDFPDIDAVWAQQRSEADPPSRQLPIEDEEENLYDPPEVKEQLRAQKKSKTKKTPMHVSISSDTPSDDSDANDEPLESQTRAKGRSKATSSKAVTAAASLGLVPRRRQQLRKPRHLSPRDLAQGN